MANKRWDDLGGAQKSAVVVSGIVQVALLVAALADIYRRSEDEIKGRKSLWAAASFINFVGPISYTLIGRKR